MELGNVTKKVHNAILAVLDMYFACKCDEFTVKQTYEIDKLGMIMEAHLNILWNLKQAIMYEDPRGTLMRKPHGTAHIGDFIRRFGPIIYADTDSFESSHKKFTTGVWRGTSKRLGTLVKEMTTASVIQSCAGHLEFYTTLQENKGITKCLEEFGPKIIGDGLVIDALPHISDIRFIATSELYKDGQTNVLIGVGIHSDLFDTDIFGHNSLPSIQKLSYYIKLRFKNVWNHIISENTNTEFSVIRAVKYEGSKESGVGKGVIYATANNAGKGPRYDYVTVKTNYTNEETGENIESYDVAQVLMIIQVHVYKNIQNIREWKSSKWYFIVQYMQKATFHLYDKPFTIQNGAIKQLIWETKNNKSNLYNVDMISADNIAGSAMVIPYFSFHKKGKNGTTQKIATPTIGKPSSSDKFWYVDRKFFDRSGWEQLKEYNNNNSINSSSSSSFSSSSGSSSSSSTARNQIDINNIQEFIDANSVEIDEPPPMIVVPRFDFPEFDEYNDYEEDSS